MFKRGFLQVGLLAFVTTALALSAQAAKFSEENLKGSYSFLVHKWTLDPSYPEVAMVGVLTFNGEGSVSGSATAVAYGVSGSGEMGGTYTVNSDGTGAIDITTSPVGPFQLAIVLNSTSAGLAHGFLFVGTGDEGKNEVAGGTALLQSQTPVHYSLASVNGSFAEQTSAWSADPDFGEQGGIGTITFDGKGNIEESFTAVANGEVHTVTLTGTYVVNADGTCSGFVTRSGGSKSTFACALNSVGPLGANGFQSVVTNPQPNGADGSTNYAVTATAVKQSAPSISIP